jgi:hypothetical protein
MIPLTHEVFNVFEMPKPRRPFSKFVFANTPFTRQLPDWRAVPTLAERSDTTGTDANAPNGGSGTPIPSSTSERPPVPLGLQRVSKSGLTI